MTTRRVRLGAPILLYLFIAVEAFAQTYPARPMRMVIPNPPGGTLDIAARLVGPKMTELSGQPVIVDHRPDVIPAPGGDPGAFDTF